MNARLAVGAHSIDDPASHDGQALLARAHEHHQRVSCLCADPPPPMYVARVGERYVVKRMPGSGMGHRPDCVSWSPAEEISGLGQVLGEAISDNPDTGITTLRLGFSLSQSATSMPAPAPSGTPGDSVATDPAKLTLLAVLHYLWDQSGLTTWSPGMDGKRDWAVVSWWLRKAAHGKAVKGSTLGRSLYVPEPFTPERADQITARRLSAWAPARPVRGKAKTPLMLLVGEVAAFTPTRFGHALAIEHMPDAPMQLEEKFYGRITKRFADEIEMWEADPGIHLMAIATFAVGPTGLGAVQEIALMTVDEHWLPFDTTFDRHLMATAIHQRRRFTRSLRYNLPATAGIAAVVFTDTPAPVAAFVVDDTTTPIGGTDDRIGRWEWHVETELPDLPEPRFRDTARALPANQNQQPPPDAGPDDGYLDAVLADEPPPPDEFAPKNAAPPFTPEGAQP